MRRKIPIVLFVAVLLFLDYGAILFAEEHSFGILAHWTSDFWNTYYLLLFSFRAAIIGTATYFFLVKGKAQTKAYLAGVLLDFLALALWDLAEQAVYGDNWRFATVEISGMVLLALLTIDYIRPTTYLSQAFDRLGLLKADSNIILGHRSSLSRRLINLVRRSLRINVVDIEEIMAEYQAVHAENLLKGQSEEAKSEAIESASKNLNFNIQKAAELALRDHKLLQIQDDDKTRQRLEATLGYIIKNTKATKHKLQEEI